MTRDRNLSLRDPTTLFHRRRVIGILDLVTKSPRNSLYGRLMNASLASIMPQVLGVWCEEAGHDVRYLCYTGGEDLLAELPDDLDVLFIGAFTQAAQLAYALSNLFRGRGAITVLGGPHARCYPEDAQQYFDYVLGFTDRAVVQEVLEECAAAPANRPDDFGGAAALRSAVSGCALEIRGGHTQEGAHDQDRADDREPGLPLHLQLLHRFDGGVPAARIRAAE